jgi:hypothetical protein
MLIRCPKCQLEMDVPGDCVGRRLQCPGCRHAFACPRPKVIVLDEVAPPEGSQRPEGVIVLKEVVEPGDERIGRGPEAGGAGSGEADGPASRPGATPLDAMAAAAAKRSERLPPEQVLARMGGQAPEKAVREDPRQWHVIVGGVPAVALTFEELVRQAAAGQVKPRSRVYYAPQGLTLSAREIPGLFPDLDAKRRQEAKAASRPARRLSAAEKAEASTLAEALGSVGEPPAGPAPQKSDEVNALADALGDLERRKVPPQ